MKHLTRLSIPQTRAARKTGASLDQLEKLVPVSRDSHTPLNLVLVYEDDATREWAREARERVTRIAGEQRVSPTWWKLSNLSDPGVLAAAASTAARADLIVVAVRTTEGLPLPFYAWTSAWATNRRQWPGVMVGLFGKTAKRSAHRGRLGDYLQAIAQQLSMAFVVEMREAAEPMDTQASLTGGFLGGNMGRRYGKPLVSTARSI